MNYYVRFLINFVVCFPLFIIASIATIVCVFALSAMMLPAMLVAWIRGARSWDIYPNDKRDWLLLIVEIPELNADLWKWLIRIER